MLALALLGYLVARLCRFRARYDVLVAAVVTDLALEPLLLGATLYSCPCARWLPMPLWLAPLWGDLALGLRRLHAWGARSAGETAFLRWSCP